MRGRFPNRRIVKGKSPKMGTDIARFEIRRKVRVDGYRGRGRGKEDDGSRQGPGDKGPWAMH